MGDAGAMLLALELMVGIWIVGWLFAVGAFVTAPLLNICLSLLLLARTARSGRLPLIALECIGIVVASLFNSYTALFGGSSMNTRFKGMQRS
jgi:hypothetical protein